MRTSSLTKGVLLPLLAAGSLALAGCTGEPGTASPTSSLEPGPPTSSAPATSASVDSPTAAIDPCGLLEVGFLEKEFPSFTPFSDGAPERAEYGDATFAGGRWCAWSTETESASDPRLSVAVGMYDSAGIKDIPANTGETEKGTLGSGREAAQTPRPITKACFIALAVGDSARVDVYVRGDEKACDMAAAVADKVDPKLPKG